MDFKFKVHSAVVDKVQATVTLPGGAQVPALVDGLVVELVSDDASMSQTYRFIPGDYGVDLASAQALFTPGAELTVSVAAAA